MSLILSIETATTICSVALHDNDMLVGSQSLYMDKSHSALLAPSVKSLITYCGYAVQDVSAVAVSCGPGSYTGLRIGVSTAKGLCFALDVPLISINTLEAMAYGMSRYNNIGALLCPMIDARRMEVYSLLADSDLNILQPTAPIIIEESSFRGLLNENKVIFFGNGAMKCQSVIQHDNAIFLENDGIDAKNIGTMALQKWENKDFEDVAYFEPFYLKDFKISKPKKR